MKQAHMCALLAMAAMLSACGNTKQDRALTGAGIGAGVGAVGGAIVGGNPAAGAAIGAGVGAATGALTDEAEIDLGKPVWKR